MTGRVPSARPRGHLRVALIASKHTLQLSQRFENNKTRQNLGAVPRSLCWDSPARTGDPACTVVAAGWVGVGPYLYLVVDVIPEPKRHDPENSLRREGRVGRAVTAAPQGGRFRNSGPRPAQEAGKPPLAPRDMPAPRSRPRDDTETWPPCHTTGHSWQHAVTPAWFPFPSHTVTGASPRPRGWRPRLPASQHSRVPPCRPRDPEQKLYLRAWSGLCPAVAGVCSPQT